MHACFYEMVCSIVINLTTAGMNLATVLASGESPDSSTVFPIVIISTFMHNLTNNT